MKNKYLICTAVLVLFLVSSVSLTGCSAKMEKSNTTGPGTAAGQNTKVRVALFPNLTHSQALIGKDGGQFQEAVGKNNQIEWKVFNAGPSEIEALFAGEVDLGYIGPGPAINGCVKSGGDLQIIAGAADAGTILVSRRNLVIKDIKQLSGKKVAVPQFGNTQDLLQRKILQENGLKDTVTGGTVEIRQAENPDIKGLLDKGDIDAAIVPEPWGSRLVKEVNANVVLDYNQIWRNGDYTTAVLIVRKEFALEHPDIVKNFVSAHVELTGYINKNPDKAREIVNKQIGLLTQKPLARDVLDSAFSRLTITSDPEKDSVRGLIEMSNDAGILRSKPDPEDLFNLDILNQVLKEKGANQIE
jgi:NitT/TauT family transport system substrate-binding protein